MKSGQRDLHDNSSRRLSISYEELETLHESIKASVLKELRAELVEKPVQKEVLNQNYLNTQALNQKASSPPPLNPQALKDSILSQLRAELIGGGALSGSASLKASILNELRMELGGASGAGQKLKEMKILHDGLLRELLDQKTIVKKLEEQVREQSQKLEKLENKAPVPQPPLLDDSLDLPPLSRKPGAGITKRAGQGRERIEVREIPAPLPGSSANVKLKIKDEPEGGVVGRPETKCEYIIAESGELKARQVPKRRSGMDENRKCEFIVAEQPSRPTRENEDVVRRDDQDVEIITCKRKILNTQ